MVTFVLGNSIKKRAVYSVKNSESEVYVDDMRITCDLIRNGVYYYVTDKRLFVNMQVGDFVLYSRILFDGNTVKDRKKLRALLRSLGYNSSLKRKIGKVDIEDYIKILFASKVKDSTEKVYVNLDGWKYSRKNLRRLVALMRAFCKYSLVFLVSDFRFCKGDCSVLYQRSDGETVAIEREKERMRLSKNKFLAFAKKTK